MNKKLILSVAMALLTFFPCFAQRQMEKLDRGLVAMKADGGIFLSWRVLGEEYYDVKYNVYRNGTKLNSEPLNVSNYTDTGGSVSDTYTVRPVVCGVEGTDSKTVTPWADNYIELKAPTRISNDGKTDITKDYEPNDATAADLDGDGEYDLIVKMVNTQDAAKSYPNDATDFDRIEAYKLNGTRLWWVDVGRNMVDFQSNEIDIGAYDWDGDGKAECVMRAADGLTIHAADGKSYVIGDPNVNTRPDLVRGGATTFTHTGAEYLVYFNGATGVPYNIGPDTHPTYMEYPLKRLEDGETDLATAWGDGYGHRSSKNYIWAPYLDGRHPSIALGRGIYTRQKLITFDVDPTTHKLVERWRWSNNTPGSIWYGQGYHNMQCADVDWDGRDEIIFGSDVIDDDGQGLSSTGLGHGDSFHIGDFNPYIHGQEIAACCEDNPVNDYRDATTGKIYYRVTGSRDAGRALAGNFDNNIPGAQFITAYDSESLISCVANKHIDSENAGGVTQNFRIYWDGDLCDESYDYTNGENTTPGIYKYGKGLIATLNGAVTNNGTKGTPCLEADLFGDWREEIVARTPSGDIRIYTTNIPTTYREYTLMQDPQYRESIVWQMLGYNQTPHPSFFLGEMEGITSAPPSPMMTDRTEISNNGTISSSVDDKQIILAETNDMTVNVSDGAKPYIFYDNAPSWVKGHQDNDNIETIYYTHTLTGGAFTGSMRMVKMGDGVLSLPKVTETYTGNTDVWAGTLNFDGTMQNSRVWLNRFAVLNSNGGKFPKGIKADYGASVRPGGLKNKGTLETDTLSLGFGSIVDFDIYADHSSDTVTAKVLKLEKKDWKYGPEYLVPRFNFTADGDSVKAGVYTIAKVDSISGNLSSAKITGLRGHKASLSYVDGKILLTVADLRDPASVVWTGETDNVWDLADKENFENNSTESSDVFVTGDQVTFNDNASKGDINIAESVSPGSITFDNTTLNYVLNGDSIAGTSSITKKGTANVTINNINTFTGSVNINGGSITVGSLGAKDGVNNGAFGKYTNTIYMNGGTLTPGTSMVTNHPFILNMNGGTINTESGVTLTLNGMISGTGNTLTKTGDGTLVLAPTAGYGSLIVDDGVVNATESNNLHGYPATIILNGGTLYDPDNIYTYSTNNANINVPEGALASWYMDERCNYKGTLTGSGTLNVYATGPRMEEDGDWSGFTGNLNIAGHKTGRYDPMFTLNNTYGMKNATLNISVATTNSNKNFAIGNLKGSAVLSGSGIWTIGNLGEDITFNGTFSGGSIVKTGSGSWTLSTLQSGVGGNTTVNGGVLNLMNTAQSGLFFGNHDVVVSGSGILAGQAYVNNIYVNNGGIIAPGNYVQAIKMGSLKAQGSIFCYDGSTVRFFIRNNKQYSSSLSYLEAGSTISINGNIVVEAYSGYVPAAGDTFTLWSAGSFLGKPTNITLPELPDGLAWDTSSLYQPTGILKVIATTGISNLKANEEFSGVLYTVDGIRLADITTTKAKVQQDVRCIAGKPGVYVIRVSNDSFKIVVK